MGQTVLELPGDWGDSPTAVVDSHVIYGVEVSALSAPRCRPPSTTFFLVRQFWWRQVSPSAVYSQITFVGITRVGIAHCDDTSVQWRTQGGGGSGVQPPPIERTLIFTQISGYRYQWGQTDRQKFIRTDGRQTDALR